MSDESHPSPTGGLEPEGATRRFIPLSSGVELHVLDWAPAHGDGAGQAHTAAEPSTPFVLTHGLASNARLWDGVARRLAAAGHRVVTVDQRGHGRSSKPDDGYDISTCADDLLLLVDELDLGGAPVIGGQSWGGNVVLEVAARHGDRLAAAVCVDGGFIDLQSTFDDWEACRTALAPPQLAGTPLSTMTRWLASSARDWPEEGRAGTLANFEVRSDGTIAPWLTAERHLLVLRGLWEHRPTQRYAVAACPTLMVVAESGGGTWNETKHVAVREAVGALPVGRGHWFTPAHHDVHAQHPQEMAELLLRAPTDPTYWSDPGIIDETVFTDSVSPYESERENIT